MKEECYRFDARPHFPIMYFPDTQEGIRAINEFWSKNWLIGVHPKITKQFIKVKKPPMTSTNKNIEEQLKTAREKKLRIIF